jgi:hypothetical protein
MEIDKSSLIVQRFLANPYSRDRFNAFYELCYRLTLGFLGYLRVRGYQLPAEPVSDRNPLSDLAIDVLGPFLMSTRNQPYAVIFDYFRKQGITDFQQTDSAKLYNLFKSLLFGFIPQELRRLRIDINPQLGNLKRRFNDILKNEHYAIFSVDNLTKFVCCAGDAVDLRDDLPPISYPELLELVEEAYHCDSRNRTAWCHHIFEALEKMTHLRNCLKKHELLRAVVTVNTKYVEVDGFSVYMPPSPEYFMMEKTVDSAIQQTLVWLQENILQGFIKKGRLSSEIAKKFIVAAERYLLDLIYSPEVDLLPVYFREVMPEDEYSRYLQDYKYLFETTIAKAEEDFRRRARKKL